MKPLKMRATITIDYDPSSAEDEAAWVENLKRLRGVILESGYADESNPASVVVEVKERRVPRVEQPQGIARFRRRGVSTAV